MLRPGPLRILWKIAFPFPLVIWAPFSMKVYHDLIWYPNIGKSRIRKFKKTSSGKLFNPY
jgi:hypothetical protein